MTAEFGERAKFRLEQLQAQAAALRQSLSLHRDVFSAASGIPEWFKTTATAIFWEARQLLPDAKYFQHLSASGLNITSANDIRTTMSSRFDCDALLAMTEAAARQYTGDAPRIGFRTVEQ